MTAVIICLAKVNYQENYSPPDVGRPMQVNGAFNSIEKSLVINIYYYFLIVDVFQPDSLGYIFAYFDMHNN